jgi:hypothetical protein
MQDSDERRPNQVDVRLPMQEKDRLSLHHVVSIHLMQGLVPRGRGEAGRARSSHRLASVGFLTTAA